jgi:hypothetical protein
MKIQRETISDKGLFTGDLRGPETLTQETMAGYLSKGRRMRSAKACDLFKQLWRLLESLPIRIAGWLGAIQPKTKAALAEPIRDRTASCRHQNIAQVDVKNAASC